MAAVSMWKFITNNFAVKVLSLAVASIFWFSVTAEKEIVKSFSAPVKVINMPPGLIVADNLPKAVDVTVTGPGILFFMYPFQEKTLTLDLQKTGKGTVVFPDLQKCLDLPSGVRVIRVYPSSIELKLARRAELLSTLR